MKDYFRQSMAWLHTWTGLVLGWLLFFMFATGSAGYFDTEIDRWMQPELPVMAAEVDTAAAAALALARLQQVAPAAERWFIRLPHERADPYLRILWQGAGRAGGPARGEEQLELATGRPLAARDTGGGQLLYAMHWKLHYLPQAVAEWAVGVATMFMLVALVTGVVVHKKIFADFFTFRPAKGQRSWLDAHNVASVITLPFQLMITYSGLVFLMLTYLPLIVAAYYGPGAEGRRAFSDEMFAPPQLAAAAGVAAPLAPLGSLIDAAEARWGGTRVHSIDLRHPGDANARVILSSTVAGGPLRSAERLVFDGVGATVLAAQPAEGSAPKRVRDVLLGLHEGLFAPPLLRWLYFVSGLLGAAMIATGLVLWTVKRRQRTEKAGAAPHLGLRLVERLNVGTLAGLPIGIAAYFWANRLLPLELGERAAWEAHALFIAWALMLIHAALRAPARAWVEQLWLAAAAFALLPLLNAFTTDRHLVQSLAAGDWVFAGFDLAVLAFGAAFALGTHHPSLAPFTGSPTAKTLPASSASRHTGLRPAHCSANTWMSFCASAFSMVTLLPGSASVRQS